MRLYYGLFGTKEEHIAYKILNANPKSTSDYCEEQPLNWGFVSSEDRKKAVEWLSKAIRLVLNIIEYNNLSLFLFYADGTSEKTRFEEFLSQTIYRHSSTRRFPLIFDSLPSERWEIYWTAGKNYGSRTAFFPYKIRIDNNFSDEEAI